MSSSETPDQSVTVRYRLTRADVARGQYWILVRLRSLRWILAIVLALIGVSAALRAWGTVIGLLAWLLIFLALLALAPLYAWRRQPILHGIQTVTIGSNGIAASTTGAESRIDWELVAEVAELADGYLSRYPGRQFGVLPRRAFASESDEQLFRSLVKNHCSKHRLR